MEDHRGAVANVLDCNIEESELQSRYYVDFQAYTVEKGKDLLIPQLWVK